MRQLRVVEGQPTRVSKAWLAEFAPGGATEVRSYPLQSIARKLLDFSASLIPDSLGFFSLLSRAHMNMNLDETPTTTCALHDLQHDPVFQISRDYPGILIVLISFWSGMG